LEFGSLVVISSKTQLKSFPKIFLMEFIKYRKIKKNISFTSMTRERNGRSSMREIERFLCKKDK